MSKQKQEVVPPPERRPLAQVQEDFWAELFWMLPHHFNVGAMPSERSMLVGLLAEAKQLIEARGWGVELHVETPDTRAMAECR
jgi:hypothetical protein